MAKFNLITQLLLQTGDYEKGLNKIKKDTQTFTNGLNKIGDGVKYLGGLAAGFLAVGSTVEFAKKLINATNDSGDAFAATMQGASQATTELFKRIATGNFDNLLQGLKEANELGIEYAKILDLIEDRKRSLTVSTSKSDYENSKLFEIYQNKNNSKDVRLDAINQILEKEKELGKVKNDIAQQEYNAALSIILSKKEWTKEEQNDLEQLLLTFNSADALREAAIKYNSQKEEANYNPTWGTGGYKSTVIMGEIKNKAKEYIAQLSDEQKAILDKYYQTLLKYSTANGEEIDKWVESYKNLFEVQKSVQQRVNELTEKQSGLQIEIAKENETKEDLLKAEQDAVDMAKAKLDYQNKYNASIERLKQLTSQVNNLIPAASHTISVDKNSAGANKGYGQRTQLEPIDIDALTTRYEKAAQEFNDRISEVLEGGLSNTLTSMFEAYGEIMAGGKTDWTQLILGNLVTVLQQLGQMAVAAGVAVLGIKKAFESLNGYAAIAAGAALLALAGAVKYSMNKQSEKFEGYATGGVVGGTSYTGDRVLVGVNSNEVIVNGKQQANLLFAIANGAAIGGGGEVKFRIEGDDLVGVISKHNKKLNSYR